MALETRRLGRTDHHSSLAILGGACFAMSTPDEAERPFREAIERGVNHLDIAPGYARAEAAVGPHIPAVRDRLFVACKTSRKNPRKRPERDNDNTFNVRFRYGSK